MKKPEETTVVEEVKDASAPSPWPEIGHHVTNTDEVVKKAEKKKKAKKAAPPPAVNVRSRTVDVPEVKALPKVTLDVYLLAKQVKPDQTAGFRRWMKGRKVRRQTMVEWDAMWKEFHERPIAR